MTATEEPLRYRWQREDHRYYEARLQRDLFGWVIVRIWGRVGSRLGQVRTVPVDNYREGEAVVAEIARRRAARRYCLVAGQRTSLQWGPQDAGFGREGPGEGVGRRPPACAPAEATQAIGRARRATR